jgi:hypothetical protein
MKKIRRIRIIYWAFKKRITVEIILSAITLLIYILTISGYIKTNMVLLIAMVVLASFYFLTTFLPTVKADVVTKVASRVSGIIAAVIIMGILFSFLSIDGYKDMLQFGGATLSIIFVIFLISMFRRVEAYVFHLMVRSVILMVLAWYVFMNPAVMVH